MSVFHQFNTALTALGVEAGPIAWGLAQAGLPDKDLVELLSHITAKTQTATEGGTVTAQ